MCIVSLRGSGFFAHVDPTGRVPSETYTPSNHTCPRGVPVLRINVEGRGEREKWWGEEQPSRLFLGGLALVRVPAKALFADEGQRSAEEALFGQRLRAWAETVLVPAEANTETSSCGCA